MSASRMAFNATEDDDSVSLVSDTIRRDDISDSGSFEEDVVEEEVLDQFDTVGSTSIRFASGSIGKLAEEITPLSILESKHQSREQLVDDEQSRLEIFSKIAKMKCFAFESSKQPKHVIKTIDGSKSSHLRIVQDDDVSSCVSSTASSGGFEESVIAETADDNDSVLYLSEKNASNACNGYIIAEKQSSVSKDTKEGEKNSWLSVWSRTKSVYPNSARCQRKIKIVHKDDDQLAPKRSSVSSNNTPTSYATKQAKQLLADIDSTSRCSVSSGGRKFKETSKPWRCICFGAVMIFWILVVFIALVMTRKKFSINQSMPPTLMPTGDEATTELSTWYVDWNAYQCIQDCVGSPSCEKYSIPNNEERFTSLEHCCVDGFASFLGEHWDLDECMALGLNATNRRPDAPTMQPTEVKSDMTSFYYADWSSSKCIEEDSSIKNPWDTGYITLRECCDANFSWETNGACFSDIDGIDDERQSSPPTSVLTESTIHPTNNASNGENYRIITTSSSSTASTTTTSTSTTTMSTATTTNTTSSSTSNIVRTSTTSSTHRTTSTTTTSTTSSSFLTTTSSAESTSTKGSGSSSTTSTEILMYYANYVSGTCTQFDSTQEPYQYMKGYNSKIECCRNSFNWESYSGDCEFGATTTSTSAVTSKNDTKNNTSPSPSTLIPTSASPHKHTNSSRFSFASTEYTESPSSEKLATPEPSHSPSQPKTRRPTRHPITHETYRPTAQPTWRPTTRYPTTVRPTTRKPTTLRPTTRNPTTLRPTSRHPTTGNPTGNPTITVMDRLKTYLKTVSPASSDALDYERSIQHRAMEWLLGNANFSTYSNERKVQRWALAILYNSLNGDEWTMKDGWTEDDGDRADECSWYGIVCDSSSYVIAVELSNNNLRGVLEAEFTLLTKIEYAILNTNLIWEFPPGIFSMPQIRVLDLDQNRIEEIPTGITVPSGGSRLEELYLGHNKIGSIPDGLFQLKNVTYLWLSNNRLSTQIPSGLGMMTKLEELDLERNYFTGSIPTEVFNLANLRHLYLHDNALSGTLSPSLSRLINLEVLDVDKNYISGTIPTQIGLLRELSELHLGDNKIVGQVPWPQLAMLNRTLTKFDVSSNYLNSTIGSQIGSLSKLVMMRLDNNYRLDGEGNLLSNGFQGTIPEAIGSLEQLVELRLDNNMIAGSIPAALGNMRNLATLRLESNNLKSSIPSELGNLTSLEYLHLWSNYLSSTISAQLGKLQRLKELFLDDNELTGTIPPTLGVLSNATYISLATNKLRGTIPPSFGMLSSLERLDLQFNQLSGKVPYQISNTPIIMMKLEGNNLYGDIPDGICQSIEFLSADCATNGTTGLTARSNYIRGLQANSNSQSPWSYIMMKPTQKHDTALSENEAKEEYWNLPVDFDLYSKHEVTHVYFPRYDGDNDNSPPPSFFRLECIDPVTPLDICNHGTSSSLYDATGHCVWAGAFLLIQCIHELLSILSKDIQGKRMIEFGCGTGIGGLAMLLANRDVGNDNNNNDAPIIPSHVTFTDSDPSALRVCDRNCKLNNISGSSYSVMELTWGEESFSTKPIFDLGLATDVVYDVKMIHPLFKTVSSCVVPGGIFILSHIPRACFDKGTLPDAMKNLEQYIIDMAEQYDLYLETIVRSTHKNDGKGTQPDRFRTSSFSGGGIIIFRKKLTR